MSLVVGNSFKRFFRAKVAWFKATKIDYQFLQYNTGGNHPEFHHVLSGSGDFMGRGFDNNVLRYPFIPDAFIAGLVFFVEANRLRTFIIHRQGILQAIFIPEQI